MTDNRTARFQRHLIVATVTAIFVTIIVAVVRNSCDTRGGTFDGGTCVVPAPSPTPASTTPPLSQPPTR